MANVHINITCKRCGMDSIVEQTVIGAVQIVPCYKCIKDLALKVLEQKEAEFLATYSTIKDEVVADPTK